MALDHWTQPSETRKDLTGTSILSRTYAATLGEIITKSNVGRQQFTREETKRAIGIFYEVCNGLIPEHRLNDCYIEASRTRNNTFALKPEDLCAAWNVIRRSEFYKRVPDSRQLTSGYCPKCNTTGTEVLRDAKGNAIGARACRH